MTRIVVDIALGLSPSPRDWRCRAWRFRSAIAQEACGLCNTDIVTNSELATCFLDEYQKLADANGAVIVVDLSGCETTRGGLEALPGPTRPARRSNRTPSS